MTEKTEENAIYRQLSVDMRDGLKNIYQQITTASAESGTRQNNTDALFTEASDQLDEVVKATENAAMSIMEVVENQLELARESAGILADLAASGGAADKLARLEAINAKLEADLTQVLTALSFQDITGQRIKKVVSTLNAIEDSVVQLYLSSGLVMEGAEKEPGRDAGELRKEVESAVAAFRENRGASKLKGPDKNGVSQSAIDDMLAQLGL